MPFRAVAGEVHAQRGLPKQKGIQITAGWVDGFSFVKAGRRANFYGSVAFSRYNRNSTRWLVGLEYLQKDYTYRGEVVPKAQFTGEAGYFVPLAARPGPERRAVGGVLGADRVRIFELGQQTAA